MACITDEPGPALSHAELVTGLTYNCVETFTDADLTWADWVNPWITSPTARPVCRLEGSRPVCS